VAVTITTTPGIGGVATGALTVTDALGVAATMTIPKVIITSSLAVIGVAGQSFSYAILAMGVHPQSYSASGLPDGLVLAGNVISGAPTLSGSAEVIIQAFNSVGSDTRTLKLTVMPYAPPPPSPTALIVNGQAASLPPTYSNGQPLALSWTITNDITSLPTPSTVIEFRDVLGAVKLTVDVASSVVIYTLLNANLQSVYGGQPNVVIRLYSKRADVLSTFYEEVTVIRV
jgi:hypothetical protein